MAEEVMGMPWTNQQTLVWYYNHSVLLIYSALPVTNAVDLDLDNGGAADAAPGLTTARKHQ
ncbi:hypothetical protein BC828DRAFT_409212 [Blastocladiella britannica]|nr:hypothetical protein BC828DRAFT_409212 [Blastocladiella britannica]